MNPDRPIAVIIAAYKAQDTIAKAVRSALDCPEVAEVVVVDDMSPDQTARAASDAAPGDGRVKVLLQDRNRGPAAARNRALGESTAPIIAMLDADDIFLPGRFTPLLASDDWDLIGDNVVFFSAEHELAPLRAQGTATPAHCHLSFEDFALGNIPQRGVRRGELGFLKPLIRRSFLERHGLTYDEDCRLGEDFLLYIRALACGGRFKVVSSNGYAGLVRQDSLSSQHQVGDLRALMEHEMQLLKHLPLNDGQKDALQAHMRSTRRRLHYREVLQIKQNQGFLRGGFAALCRPTSLLDWWQDFTASGAHVVLETPRMLLSQQDFDRYAR